MNELPGPILSLPDLYFFPSRFFTFFRSIVTSSSVVEILVSACVTLSEQSVMSLRTFSIAVRMPSNLDEISAFIVLIAVSIVPKEVLVSSLAVAVLSSGCLKGLPLPALLAAALASMASALVVSLALAAGVAKLVTLVCCVLLRFDFLGSIGIFLNPGVVIGLHGTQSWPILARY